MIIDSKMTRDEALRQNPAQLCPRGIQDYQELETVRYRGFDGKRHQGQIVVHRDLVADVRRLFTVMYAAGFPLGSVIPVSDPRFAWDDERSMAANNSSGFNYRWIAGTSLLSHHAFGRAVDLNPMQNPIVKNGVVSPSGALYAPALPGTFRARGPIVGFMHSQGWEWGGDWPDPKDYHHFQKP